MRNYEGDRLVRNEVTPGCEWVLAGEGIPTRKFDGSACMIENQQMFKRYDAKNGKILRRTSSRHKILIQSRDITLVGFPQRIKIRGTWKL